MKPAEIFTKATTAHGEAPTLSLKESEALYKETRERGLWKEKKNKPIYYGPKLIYIVQYSPNYKTLNYLNHGEGNPRAKEIK